MLYTELYTVRQNLQALWDLADNRESSEYDSDGPRDALCQTIGTQLAEIFPSSGYYILGRLFEHVVTLAASAGVTLTAPAAGTLYLDYFDLYMSAIWRIEKTGLTMDSLETYAFPGLPDHEAAALRQVAVQHNRLADTYADLVNKLGDSVYHLDMTRTPYTYSHVQNYLWPIGALGNGLAVGRNKVVSLTPFEVVGQLYLYAGNYDVGRYLLRVSDVGAITFVSSDTSNKVGLSFYNEFLTPDGLLVCGCAHYLGNNVLEIYDLRDPENFNWTPVWSIDTGPAGYPRAVWVTGKTLFAVVNRDCIAYDITDPTAPVELSRHSVLPVTVLVDIQCLRIGAFLVVNVHGLGLYCIDVSDPANMTVTAYATVGDRLCNDARGRVVVGVGGSPLEPRDANLYEFKSADPTTWKVGEYTGIGRPYGVDCAAGILVFGDLDSQKYVVWDIRGNTPTKLQELAQIGAEGYHCRFFGKHLFTTEHTMLRSYIGA